MAEVNVSLDTFEEEVIGCDIPVIVDFWATWCGPCRMIGPVLEKIAAGDPDFKICKVNVDEEPELAKKFNVRSIPMLIVMKDGEQAAVTIGAQPESEILKFVKNA